MNTTIENTRLILEFMGYEVINYQHNELKPIYSGHNSLKKVGEFKKLWQGLDIAIIGRFTEYVKIPFDTDFNYIMPVVAKIEQLPDIYEQEEFLLIRDELCTGRIDTVLDSIINFINSYNQQKN